MQLSPVNTKEREELDIRPGDTVRVHQRIQETVVGKKGKTEKKTRVQAFDGLVIARKHGKEPGATFTVRKIIEGIGTELTFPLYSPKIEKIELVSRPKRVRRAKLYYLRERAARQVRKKMKQMKQIGKVMMSAATRQDVPTSDGKQADPPKSESFGGEKSATNQDKNGMEKPKETKKV